MSLYKESTGLLNTHVTWKDVEEKITKSLKTRATFGENRKVTCISDMKGFMSRIALVEPDWINQNSDEKLPKKFVVKISTQLAFVAMQKQFDFQKESFDDETMKKLEGIVKTLHNREVAVYKLLTADKHHHVPFTNIFSLQEFSDENPLKGFIISEYIENLYHVKLCESIPVDDLISVIKAIAEFSAIAERAKEDELKFAHGRNLLDITFNEVLNNDWKEKNKNMLRASFPPGYDNQLTTFFELSEKFYMNKEILPKYLELQNEFKKPVLTHSDFWSSNILFTKTENKYNLEAIIDFQTCCFSNPAIDIGRCFSSCLSTEDRRTRGDELIQIYYDTFIDSIDGKPAPYTFEQLKKSCALYFPLMSILMLPGIAQLSTFIDVAEKDHELLKKKAIDKMVGLLEDSLAAHYSNIQQFPEFFNF